MSVGVPELVILLVILLLFFGAARLPKLMRSVGESARELRQGLKEGPTEEPVEGDCPFCGANVPADSKFCPGCAKSSEDITAERARQKQSA